MKIERIEPPKPVKKTLTFKDLSVGAKFRFRASTVPCVVLPNGQYLNLEMDRTCLVMYDTLNEEVVLINCKLVWHDHTDA